MFNRFKKEKPSGQISKAHRFGWKKIFSFSQLHEGFYQELEESLILSDVGGKNALRLLGAFKERIKEQKIKHPQAATDLFKSILSACFIEEPWQLSKDKLNVVMVIGINGVGKTTTIAKLCHLLKKDNHILLGAADTFRAAAVEQLTDWGKRWDLPVISQSPGADPASVAYDTIHSGLANSKDLAIIDTAGRLHNKDNLLSQLNKIVNITDKFPNQIHRSVLLVLDATQGLSGFEQVKSFGRSIALDGLILTKCDTGAKGGILLAISEEFKLPIYYYTHGERPEDIARFSVVEYVDSLIQ